MKWLIAASIALLLAYLLDMGLLVYAAYVLIAALLGTRWLGRYWIEHVESQRTCSHTEAEVGTVVTISNRLVNKGRLPVSWILAEDVLPPDSQLFKPHRLEVEGERVKVFMLKPGETRDISYQCRCNRRGYYQIGPMLIETGDMFGLFRRFKVATDPNFLMVLPQPVPLEGYNLASRRPIGEIRLSHRLFEDPTRISGVRDYQPGDPMNRVNWKATARTGTLQSKVYEPSSMSGATILLDFHTDSHSAKHEPYRSELAVTTAASLAHTLYHLGQQCGLVTNGRDAADRIREEGWKRHGASRNAVRKTVEMKQDSNRLRPIVVPTRQGVDQFRQIMVSLARLELTDGLDFANLLIESQARIPHDATVIAIIPQANDDVVVALAMLVRQGFAVTAIVNTYEFDDYASASGPLIAAGVHTLHLRDEETLASICQQQLATF